jgi:hypothetical protein
MFLKARRNKLIELFKSNDKNIGVVLIGNILIFIIKEENKQVDMTQILKFCKKKKN